MDWHKLQLKEKLHVYLIQQGEGEEMLAIPAAQKPRKIKLSGEFFSNYRNMFTA
jgi:hypothetical protein